MKTQITYFKNFSDTSNPYYISLNQCFKRIKEGKSATLIEKIRQEGDKDRRTLLKDKLPCILFSGKFNYRKDSSMMEHSGYAIVDIDSVDVEDIKKKIRPYDFWKAMFVSPSGDGLKVLVKIPASKERHRGHYRALVERLRWIEGLDTTSINESRICYESYDPDIIIREDEQVVEFTDYKEEEKPPVGEFTARVAVNTDYQKLGVAARLIQKAVDGTKHQMLMKASYLAGGLIAAGMVEEGVAISILEYEISKKDNVADLAQAKRDIRSGIAEGKTRPLSSNVEAIDLSPQVEQTDGSIANGSIMNYLESVRNGTMEQGLSTGMDSLDEHFRFKRGNFVIVNGYDNVGKTLVMVFLATVSAIKHNWRWIMYCMENKEGGIAQNIIEFKTGKPLRDLSQKEYEEALDWTFKHFTILTIDDVMTAQQVMDLGENVHNRDPHDAMLIDPYNSLFSPKSEINKHEYDYWVTSMMRLWCKRTGMSLYVTCHAVTGAARMMHPKGHRYEGLPIPPSKADTEGGVKFANRADDFLTVHRYVAHKEDFRITNIHVRKIKMQETGGRPTAFDEPVNIVKSGRHACFFEQATNRSPIGGHILKSDSVPFTPVYNERDLTLNPNRFIESSSEEDGAFDIGNLLNEPPF